MIKYVALPNPPRAWDSDHGSMAVRPSQIVYEDELVPVDTGLLDAHGLRLYRVIERGKLGFEPSRR